MLEVGRDGLEFRGALCARLESGIGLSQTRLWLGGTRCSRSRSIEEGAAW